VAAALLRLGHPTISVGRIASVLQLSLPVAAFLQSSKEAFHVGQRQIVVGDEWFSGSRRPVQVASVQGFTSDQSICRVELSSGTTGRPKAVSLTVQALQQWIVNAMPQ
jgi:acyl-coenzyme A synthetase/AMP-(fatty) acid ligase